MTCPVCGWQYLREDAMNHDICPSCGTEFGLDDVGLSHEQLRVEWLRNGGEWFDKSTEPPAGWNPIAQLISAPQVKATTGKPVRTQFHFNGQVTLQNVQALPKAG